MKRLSIALAALAFALAAQAQKTHRPQYDAACAEAFGPGEKLTYVVKYGFIKGGEGTFSVRDTVVDGRHVNHIVCGGQTTGLADVVYRVRDSYESYMDPETQLPVMSKRNIAEGRYRYNDKVVYDRQEGKLSKTVKRRDKPEEKKTEEMPDRLMDIVAAFYHARNNAFDDRLAPGDTIYYQTFFSNEIFPLNIRYKGKETIKTALGPRLCYKFAPVTEAGRSFEGDDDMHLWITADSNRIPVKIKFDMKVGSFVFELTKAEGLKH
ncbi:MAG: DUF3108 domain-containing protein [Bacteroidales bacterium]|nr:DUF3108 domain-containing protein [Bacteroidales bacterium]